MKKQSNVLRIVQKTFTVFTLGVAVSLAIYTFMLAYYEVYSTSSFNETSMYYNYGESTIIRNLYNYHNGNGASTDGSTVTYSWYADINNGSATEKQQGGLDAIEFTLLPDMRNLQVKITDTTTNKILVDTFGTGEYEFLNTTYYLDYEIVTGLQNPMTVDDYMVDMKGTYDMLKQYADYLPILLLVTGLLSLVNLGVLIRNTAKRAEDETILTIWDKIPFDIMLVLVAFLIVLTMGVGVAIFELFYYGIEHGMEIFQSSMSLTALVSAYLFVKAIETVVIRISTKTLLKNTLIYKFCVGIMNLFRRIPIIWRTLLIGIFICSINGILGMLSMTSFVMWAIFALYNLYIVILFCGIAWQMKQLQKGAEALATGKFEDKIDTHNMYFDCKKYGETLNQIGEGIGVAVEEKMQSERMKTDLITNVSHDIKTPLTSIVTSIELLQQEHSKEQNKEYLDLLQRQCMRMKKLVDDLVEATKASTGNITVDMVEMDLVEAVQQALGEYELRFAERNLTLLNQFPEQCIVKADGKYLWRVLDNVLGNVHKYAQEHTRVYVLVEQVEEKSIISIKNISAKQLNMSVDELMERFVRGDSARTTEGSGLGLNIAQGLMMAQNGELDMSIDGDLVKVQLIFMQPN